MCNGLLSLLLELNGDLPEQFPGHARRLYIWTCRRKACRRKDGCVRAVRGVRLTKGTGPKAGVKAETKEPAKQQEPVPPQPQPKIGESLFGVGNGTSTRPSANPFSNPFATHSNGTAPSNSFTAKPGSAPLFGAVPPTVQVTSDTQADKKTDKKEDEAATSLPETFAAKVRLSSPPAATQTPRPHEPWPAASAFPTSFPHYQLDAEYETLDAPSTPVIPSNARIDIDTEGNASAGGKEDKEVYESTLDETFQKFADRIGQNPEQALRYEFKGKPLLYSDHDAVGKLLGPYSENGPSSNKKVTITGSRGRTGIPCCLNCGAERVFELQLMPHAITELEAEDMSIDGMEWGTIIVGVCSQDCQPSDIPEGGVGYVEEWAGVQWEEIASKK